MQRTSRIDCGQRIPFGDGATGGLLEDWRAKALELFPDLRDLIETQPNPMSLWIELSLAIETVYAEKPLNDERVGKFYDYAAWCLKQPRAENAETDLSTAVAVCFIEHIPLHQSISDDLYRWMSAGSFHGFENLFRYHFSDEEFKKFSVEFHAKKKNFKGTPRL
jgi:hypothetical protein